VQAREVVHDTADSPLGRSRWAIGVASITQRAPVSPSASGVAVPETSYEPTAVQASAVVHDTPDKVTPVAPAA